MSILTNLQLSLKTSVTIFCWRAKLAWNWKIEIGTDDLTQRSFFQLFFHSTYGQKNRNKEDLMPNYENRLKTRRSVHSLFRDGGKKSKIRSSILEEIKWNLYYEIRWILYISHLRTFGINYIIGLPQMTINFSMQFWNFALLNLCHSWPKKLKS